ncbi:MAG: hypothetical protein MI919_12330, partial [Holophagales bacterium]|nr:hypothetical protein [Holophagales bacterium]
MLDLAGPGGPADGLVSLLSDAFEVRRESPRTWEGGATALPALGVGEEGSASAGGRSGGPWADAIWVVHSPWFFLHLFFALGFQVRKRLVAVYHGPWYREYYHS